MNDESRIISLKPKPKEISPTPTPVPPPFVNPEPRRPRKRSNIGIFILIGALIAVLGGVYAWWSWSDWFPEEGAPETETTQLSEESVDIITKVGELIVLPEGEEPTIAKVTDPDKLRDQVFFANAKEGDVVLIYTQAQKAYLYDPVAHKLVEVAPLTIQ